MCISTRCRAGSTQNPAPQAVQGTTAEVKVAAITVCTARLRHADAARPIGPHPITIRDVALALAAPDGVPSDGHGLGQRVSPGASPFGTKRRRLTTSRSAVGARRRVRRPMHLFVARAAARHGDDSGCRLGSCDCRDNRRHRAFEVPPAIRSHEGVVARFGHHVGQFILVQAGMQVHVRRRRTAASSSQLTLGRRRGRPGRLPRLRWCRSRLHRVVLDPTASGLQTCAVAGLSPWTTWPPYCGDWSSSQASSSSTNCSGC